MGDPSSRVLAMVGTGALVLGMAMAGGLHGAAADGEAGGAGLDAFEWQIDVSRAEALARSQDRLILCFLLLGDLTAPDC
jgi:hypothetical protein